MGEQQEKPSGVSEERRAFRERRERVERVKDALDKLFYVLKEDMSSLRPEDFDALSRGFMPEVSDYVGTFVNQIENARKRRYAEKDQKT